MKKLFVVAVVFAVALLVGGPALVSVAQTADTTAGTSVSNNAVFVTTATDFGTPTAIAIADVEAGCESLGSAVFNVDATSGWTATQIVTANVVPAAAVSSTGDKNDPFHLGASALCAALGTNGATGLSEGGNAVTSGTTGNNVTIHAGIFFSGTGANFTDAPNGSYGFTVTMTVSD